MDDLGFGSKSVSVIFRSYFLLHLCLDRNHIHEVYFFIGYNELFLIYSQSWALITTNSIVLNIFLILPKKPHTHWQPLPSVPSSHSLATVKLFSISVDLPVLDISYNWNYTISSLLHLPSFIRTMFSRFISYCTMYFMLK